MTHSSDTIVAVTDTPPASSVAWGAVIAGAAVAAVISLVLALLGAGLGLSFASSGPDGAVTTLTVGAAIWLIVMQWLSAAFGGFVTGRLRNRWSVSGDEVLFRDTAHGFLAWALATLMVAFLAGSSVSSLVGTAGQIGSSVVGGASSVLGGATQGAATGGAAALANSDSDPTAYFVDTLFRPAPDTASDEAEVAPDGVTDAGTVAPSPAPAPAGTTTTAQTPPATAPASGVSGAVAPAPATPSERSSEDIRAESARILANGLLAEEFPGEDRDYLVSLVAEQTELSPEEAESRVDQVLANAAEAKAAAAEAAAEASAATAQASFFLCLSLVIGAFIGAAAGALGGRMRDEVQ